MDTHFSLGNEENLYSLSASQHIGSLRYPFVVTQLVVYCWIYFTYIDAGSS